MSALYTKAVAAGTLRDDPGQHAAAVALQRLLLPPARTPSLFFRAPSVAARGVYLCGPPGRGKTVLATLYFEAAPEPKLKLPFHAFMRRVHDRLRTARERGDVDPLQAAVPDTSLLYIDEFEISDIADAMIMGRLLQALRRALTWLPTPLGARSTCCSARAKRYRSRKAPIIACRRCAAGRRCSCRRTQTRSPSCAGP